MRILYIAHDFPPNPSPQALRAGQLALGLAREGHDVLVLTRRPSPAWANLAIPANSNGLDITYFSPGLFELILDYLVGKGRLRPLDYSISTVSSGSDKNVGSLNWKGRTVALLRAAYASLAFPGATRGALSSARRALRNIVERWRPEKVILSHEPPGLLYLSRDCAKLGFSFIAELGDPVFSQYTPARWRRKALLLERMVCTLASRVVVTSVRTAELMASRHALPTSRLAVVTQGYFPRAESAPEPAPSDYLRLVYTGRLYPFRSPLHLVHALGRVTGVKLIIASQSVPKQFQRVLSESDDVEMLGELPFDKALALQRGADVLLNLSNRDSSQIPGKFFEYIGAERPILHVCSDEVDEQADLVKEMSLGWVVRDDIEALSHELERLRLLKDGGGLNHASLNSEARRDEFSWASVARRFARYVTTA